MARQEKSDFSKGGMAQNILRISLPVMLAELVHVTYSIVDRMYLGHIRGVGTTALTSVGIALPLITMVSAFANICGTGGAPLCAIARGEGAEERARRIQENAFTLLLLMAAVLAAGMFCFRRPLLLLMGADGETLPVALRYFSIYCGGIVFSFISLGMNPFINMQGHSGVGMGTVLIGAVANIVLDPLFIFALGLGVEGAALATVLSELLSAAWVLRFLLGKQAPLRIRGLRWEGEHIGSILKLGVTGFTAKITNSLTQAAVNLVLRQYGGELSTLYIGSMSIISSLRELASQPITSVTHGAQPVLGYNYGAGEYRRVRKGIGFVLGATLSYNLAAWALLRFAARPLAGIFTADEELIRVCVPCLQIYFAAFFMMAFQNVGQNTFIGLNRPGYAVFFSLFRKVILVLPLTLLLPRLGLGAQGVFYAEMLSQILGASTCFFTMMLTVWRDLRKKEAATLC